MFFSATDVSGYAEKQLSLKLGTAKARHSYFVLHTGQASSFGGCMTLVSYLDTARRSVSLLAKKARFVTTSNLRSCHKAVTLGGVGARR